MACKNDLQLVIEDLMWAKIIPGDFRGEGCISRMRSAVAYSEAGLGTCCFLHLGCPPHLSLFVGAVS